MATIPVSSTTRKEDERLRKELANADIGKFKKAIKSMFKPTKRKKNRHDQTV